MCVCVLGVPCAFTEHESASTVPGLQDICIWLMMYCISNTQVNFGVHKCTVINMKQIIILAMLPLFT